jgi:hypothetical protein
MLHRYCLGIRDFGDRHSFTQSGVPSGTNELTAVGQMTPQTKLNSFSGLSNA